MLDFIFWDFGPEIFSIGSFSLRWYSVGFLLAFLIGQQILFKIYKTEGREIKEADAITIYMIVGTIVGARIGHCFFYDPVYYLNNPIKILKVWEGGLASHGAAVGILLSIYLFKRKYKVSYLWLFDRIVICVALAGMFIRLGNLMNSEIVGTPTNAATAMVYTHAATTDVLDAANYTEEGQKPNKTLSAVKYEYTGKDTLINGVNYPELKLILIMTQSSNTQVEANAIGRNISTGYLARVENKNYKNITNFGKPAPYELIEKNGLWNTEVTLFGVPRHPAQTYEAFTCLILFIILWGIYRKMGVKTPHGRIFGIFLIYIFGLRFVYEFLKENQSELINTAKETSALNMGQLLSIPLVLAGIAILIYSYKKKKVGPVG